MAALIIHPNIEGKVVKKITHDPILPKIPTVHKMRFVALIHPN